MRFVCAVRMCPRVSSFQAAVVDDVRQKRDFGLTRSAVILMSLGDGVIGEIHARLRLIVHRPFLRYTTTFCSECKS